MGIVTVNELFWVFPQCSSEWQEVVATQPISRNLSSYERLYSNKQTRILLHCNVYRNVLFKTQGTRKVVSGDVQWDRRVSCMSIVRDDRPRVTFMFCILLSYCCCLGSSTVKWFAVKTATIQQHNKQPERHWTQKPKKADYT